MKENDKLRRAEIIKSLMKVGLTETEAYVYLQLAKEGPQKATDIGKALKMYKQRLYRSLRKMQSKGVITTSGYPARFSAVPFEQVLDLAIKSNIEEAERMMQNKEALLSSWRSIRDKIKS